MSKLSKSIIFVIICFFVAAWIGQVAAKPPIKSKFYDFSEQLIDGEIKRPTGLYTDSRQKVKFERLLKLKRSFMKELFQTSKEKVFK